MPKSWKLHNVVHVPKIESHAGPANNRLISITSIGFKITERILTDINYNL